MRVNCRNCVHFLARTAYCTERRISLEYVLRECEVYKETKGKRGTLSLHAGEWSLVVPFTLHGLEVARAFIDLLKTMLPEEEAEG